MTGRSRGQRSYTLLGADGQANPSPTPGTLGGHRRARIYGRLDCPSALRALARGGYAQHRVFFADEASAVAAGYRPCGTCLPEEYAVWKAAHRPLRSAVVPTVRGLRQDRSHDERGVGTGPG